jgi:hypothetical protein
VWLGSTFIQSIIIVSCFHMFLWTAALLFLALVPDIACYRREAFIFVLPRLLWSLL